MSGFLPIAVGGVALLYAAVGHAGATGYIAVMTLAGLAPTVIRPTALVLNVIVATIATVQFFRAGHFRGRLLGPLMAASVPCAAFGGALELPTHAFERLVAVVLLVSACQLGRQAVWPATAADGELRSMSFSPWALGGLGAGIGLLSGLTGVGGGVFLTPVLLTLRAAPVKQVAAITAPFILVNSVAGLIGGVAAGRSLPPVSLAVIAAVVIGGAVGAEWGAFRLPVRGLRGVLAGVLGFASLKLFGLG